MYLNYKGKELYDEINKVVELAFYKIYTHVDTNWFHIEEINLDYSVCDNDDNMPTIFVKLRIGHLDHIYNIEFVYYLEYSREFNEGIIFTSLDKADEENYD